MYERPSAAIYCSSGESRCTHVWNQNGETRCVMTVNNLEVPHIDLRIQGEPQQSPDNEDQEKTSVVVGETGS